MYSTFKTKEQHNQKLDNLIVIQVTFLIPLFFVIVIRFVILFIITTLIFNYLISKHLTSPMAAPIAQALFMI